jgi:uncharacterized iron-regulated protein
MKLPALILCAALATLLSACTTPPAPSATVRPASAPALPPPPAEFWLDLVAGEETPAADVIADLATAGAIFVGEAHTLARHHAIQLDLLQQLFLRQLPLVLCLEQLEARDQPAVDRYSRGETDFATFAGESDWPKKWNNYADYRALCEFARAHRIPIRALNAPAATIRAVSRGGGLAKLPPDLRAQLPAEIFVDDPAYERLLNLELAKHMALDPAKLRPVFEAQVARDETMAANIVAARRHQAPPDEPRTAFVVLGAGHMRYGLGTAERVRRRDPGIVERLVLLTESGQTVVTAEQKAQTRDVTITHADLRALGRPPADYLHVLPLSARPTLPPGHPPLP